MCVIYNILVAPPPATSLLMPPTLTMMKREGNELTGSLISKLIMVEVGAGGFVRPPSTA